METCGLGHDLAVSRFEMKDGRWGCRECRQFAAATRWSTRTPGRDLASRFWPKVDKRGPSDCWPWMGARIPNGYGSLGRVDVGGRFQSQVGAHRVSFFLANGYWPNVTRHICDNRPCVNPAHLLDGDTRLNARDMVERGRCPASQRTYCPSGHQYTPDNTYLIRGHRTCKTCSDANAKRHAARRMAENPVAERAKAAARQRAYRARKRAANN